MSDFENVVIGAGVIGLAIARELSRRRREVIVLEKEQSFGMRISSRNSEVIHAKFTILKVVKKPFIVFIAVKCCISIVI